MNILVIGAGYVGCANAYLFAQNHRVRLLDLDDEKVQKLRSGEMRFNEDLMQEAYQCLSVDYLNWSESSLKDDVAIIAISTDFSDTLNGFDVSGIHDVIHSLEVRGFEGKILIKSTVPIGFTDKLKHQYPQYSISFMPEFLREGHALYDLYHPARIIFGDEDEQAREILDLYIQEVEMCPILICDARHAEGIKLFANTYLAMRIAFFNELDSFAEVNSMQARTLIEGLGLDPRIGLHYHNPSFGYGGYCLPKDSRQLLAQFQNVPQCMMDAIVKANQVRKEFIFERLVMHREVLIGVYRLSMKRDADNFRNAAIIDLLAMAKKEHLNILIYEPALDDSTFMGFPRTLDLNEFKQKCHWILANRMDADLQDVRDKVYTRDLFEEEK